jgi:hypothetical protein
MHRRRPGRRACPARLPVVPALLVAVSLAGCTSSSHGPRPLTSPVSSRPPSSSTSTPKPAPSAVVLPAAPNPTPIKRRLIRPPGATLVDFESCIEVNNAVLVAMKKGVFGTRDRAEQSAQLHNLLGGFAAEEGHTAEKSRRAWLRDGYPASFPVVRDIDEHIAIYRQITAAAKTNDLEALPNLYLRLRKAVAQYTADIDDNNLCNQ